MTTRENPYGAFNFMVKLGDMGGYDQIAGGFSEVSGLGMEVDYVEYRNGNDKENHVRKLPGLSRAFDVTLRRGVIGDLRLFEWLRATSQGDAAAQTVTITMLNERRESVVSFVLRNAQPKKWMGPTLNAKGGGEVAMEELVLTCEGVEMHSL